jgi:outer membrane protein OmpA-like peptidoglycan-associated protein
MGKITRQAGHERAPVKKDLDKKQKPSDRQPSIRKQGQPSWLDRKKEVQDKKIKENPFLRKAAAQQDKAKPAKGEKSKTPAGDQAGRNLEKQLHVQPSDRSNRSPGLKYVFVFPRDNYGRAGEKAARLMYPDHQIVRANSLEQLAKRVAADSQRQAKKDGSQAHINEIVIITHANDQGGMKIPLTEKDAARQGADKKNGRNFTPWNMAALGQEMKAGKHDKLSAARKTMLDAVDGQSKVVVRGCNFGQSRDGLQATQAFFGGEAKIYAPTGVQGFELQPIGEGKDSLYANSVQAYDTLTRQGIDPGNADNPQDKQRAIQNIQRQNDGYVPGQFFIQGKSAYQLYQELSPRDRLGASSESLKTRPYTADPSLKDSLDSLPVNELVDQARALNKDYRPENAPKLLAMQESWQDRSSSELQNAGFLDPADPLSGLPPVEIFGDSNLLRADAERYAGEVVDVWVSARELGIQTVGGRDPLLDGDLQVSAPESEQARQQAEQEFGEGVLNELAAPPALERPYAPRGFVDSQPDGGLRLWNFAVGRTELREEFTPPLETLARQAQADPGLQIAVEGHTSSLGGTARNLELSQARAEAVRQFLIAAGVPEGKVTAQGFGESQLLNNDQGQYGQVNSIEAAHNRRVEIRLEQGDAQASSPNAVDLDRIAVDITQDGGKPLAEQAGKLTGEVSNRVGDVLDYSGLVIDVVSELAKEGSKLSFLALAGPIVEWIGFTVDLHNAKEQQLQSARLTGINLGMDAAIRLGIDGKLDQDITGRDIERVVTNTSVLEYEWRREWETNVVTGLAPDRTKAAMYEGFSLVAKAVNTVERRAEERLREKLSAGGLNLAATKEAFEVHVDPLRLAVAVKLDEMLRQEIKNKKAGR